MGQDLIAAAKIRATISQIEKYNTAANTFKLKYNGLPGDLGAAKASAYGFVTRSGAIANGDDNGQILSCSWSCSYFSSSCESIAFWADLASAQLIDIPPRGVFGDFTATATSSPSLQQLMPTAKTGRGFIIINYYGNARDFAGGACAVYYPVGNYYEITDITSITVSAGVEANVFGKAITPLEINNIDVKIDDGKALSGGVLAVAENWSIAGHIASHCLTGVFPNYTYDLITNPNAVACQAEIRAQF